MIYVMSAPGGSTAFVLILPLRSKQRNVFGAKHAVIELNA
jgi:hypothetical protein